MGIVGITFRGGGGGLGERFFFRFLGGDFGEVFAFGFEFASAGAGGAGIPF